MSQDVGCRQGAFGFADASFGFEDNKAGFLYALGDLYHGFLDAPRFERFWPAERFFEKEVDVLGRQIRRPWFGEVCGGHAIRDSFDLTLCDLHRESFGVRRDPVGHDD